MMVVAVGAVVISAAVRFSRTVAAPTTTPTTTHHRGGDGFGGSSASAPSTLSTVRPRSIPLQPGRVAEVLVAENQEVAQGTELLRLEDGIARSRLAEAEAAVKLAELQLHQAQQQPQLTADGSPTSRLCVTP